MIIDIHTHAFPDSLADRAIPFLEEEGDVKAHLDGTVGSLLVSMDKAGIAASVVASIATKPDHFSSIVRWSQEIASSRIIPFPSIHPDDPRALEQISEIRKSGFSGIKLHPYYQKFSLDESRIHALLGRIEREELILLLHTGYDLAYARYRLADPAMIAEAVRKFPGLKLVAPHFGAWEDWDNVEDYLLGKRIYFDTSYSIPFLGNERALRFLQNHPEDFFLFGSDSPWGDQAADLEELRNLELTESRRSKLFGDNAARLLQLN